jgi:hypothetical protein
MTDTLALENLYNLVTARFVAEGTAADQAFGWREKNLAVTSSARIVWIPGDASGSVGRMDPARNPGNNPRSLMTLRELFTVVISAEDPGNPENELAQYKATRLLADAWFRAVYLAARGTYAFDRLDWLVTQKERRYGTALQVVGAIQAMVPDVALVGMPLDTSAVIAMTELDRTETQTEVAADDPSAASEDPQ